MHGFAMFDQVNVGGTDEDFHNVVPCWRYPQVMCGFLLDVPILQPNQISFV
jgi:hypothetical protein